MPRFRRSSFDARCSRSAETSSSPLASALGSGQRAEVTRARGTLIEALPNYRVGNELTLRLVGSRGVGKSREDRYHSAVVIKSPTLRAALASQGAASQARMFLANACGMYFETKYEHSKLNSASLSVCVCVCFPIVRARRSKALVKTTRGNAR